jgi:hypothetical protein
MAKSLFKISLEKVLRDPLSNHDGFCKVLL